MSIVEVGSYCHNLEVLGSLKENERLLTNGRHFSKMQAPDRFFKNSDTPLAKIAHEILTLVLKIIQAVERLIRGEHANLNLRKIEEMTDELLDIFEKEIPEPSDDASYDALRELGKAVHQLQNCADRSLAHFQETIGKRGASLDSTVTLLDEEKASRVKVVTDKIAQEVLPKITEIIGQVEDGLYADDLQKADNFVDNLFNKRAVDQSLRFSSRAAIDTLQNRLGKPAIQRVLEFYGLSHERMLTGKDLIAISIGALANITAEDLSVHQLGHQTDGLIGISLIKLRQSIDPTILEPSKELPYSRQLEHDQMVLKYLNEMEEWTAKSSEGNVKGLKCYTYAEYLARHVTYALYNKSRTQFAEGLIIPMYDTDNELRLFTAHSIVSVKGLYGVMFKPLNPGSDQNDVHIAFRGTYCKSSILRDISPTETMQNHLFDGPGRFSFTKHQDVIYEKVIENLQGITNPIVEFHGHSLGAADAMRAMEHFMYNQAEGKQVVPVARYVLNAFNTPGIEPDLARRFMSSLRALEVETDLRYFDVHHDFIQELGSTRLGYWRSKETCPDFLKISIFKFNRRVEERIMALAKNIFKRLQFKLNKALEAHTYYCLRLHDTANNDELNSTFIQDIHTNHPEDVGVLFGKDLEYTSALQDDEDMTDHLLTTTCLVGRSMKRKALKVKKFFLGMFSCNTAQQVST